MGRDPRSSQKISSCISRGDMMEVKAVAKIRRRGDITIPASIRRHQKLGEGDHLVLISKEDHVIIKKLEL